MIRTEHKHSKIVYHAFCFKIRDYHKIEFARITEKIKSRCSFTKEFKLKVAQYFYDHDKNCNQTATHC